MLQRRFEMKEAIRREIEKERIREEIIAEVRNEMMMEREIAMRSAGGSSSQLIRRNLFEPEVLHRRPIGQEVELAMSADNMYGRSGHFREIRGFPVSALQPLEVIVTPLLEDNQKEVIVLVSICLLCTCLYHQLCCCILSEDIMNHYVCFIIVNGILFRHIS